MLKNGPLMPVARRSFLSRLAAGAAVFGAIGGTSSAAVAAQSGAFQPAKHAQDDWLDQLPGKHRMVFDTASPEAADRVRRLADNFFYASKNGYGLDSGELAVVIILRHFSTPFAFKDAMWAKYGAAMSEPLKFTDPKTNQAPVINVYNTSELTLDGLGSRGVQYAVCGMATRFFAGVIAGKSGGSADAVYQELVANVIGNAHVVPAGVVAINRAQERGYTFAYVD